MLPLLVVPAVRPLPYVPRTPLTVLAAVNEFVVAELIVVELTVFHTSHKCTPFITSVHKDRSIRVLAVANRSSPGQLGNLDTVVG